MLNRFETIQSAAGVRTAAIDQGLRDHMNKVYGTMSAGMFITALSAWAISGLTITTQPTGYGLGNGTYLTEIGYLLYASPLKWIVMLAPLAFVFIFAARINKMAVETARLTFYSFAAVMGISISWIFIAFTSFSIVQTFLVTAIAFLGLSLWGYTTKKDISGWGSFLIMGVIGLIVASLLNIFLQWEGLQFGISLLGLLIFAGLTAYDTQNIKNTYLQMAHSGQKEWIEKSAIFGALSLYLDFINMFMFLLQFMGNRE